MNDSTEEYKEWVQKRLARREDDPVVRMAEVLCFPSFHPETLLRVISGAADTTFRLATFTSSLWYSGWEELRGEVPRRVQEVATVPPETALSFWGSIEELEPETIRAEEVMGLDGMTVRASYRREGTATSFEAWSPDPLTPCGRFVRLVYDLAWGALREKASIERLEHLHGYLRLGLPVRIIGGDVTCLRIFGGLASYDREPLRALFASLPDEGPLVVDMTNFDGMGTLLYPTFKAFAAGGRRWAWACSSAARRHIKAMGFENPQVFDDVDGAIRSVRRGSRQVDTGEVAPD